MTLMGKCGRSILVGLVAAAVPDLCDGLSMDYLCDDYV